MAANDKNDLLIQIATELPDNNTGDINPANIRTTESALVTYNVNMEELTEQVIQGVLKHMQGTKFNSLVTPPAHDKGLVFYDDESNSLSYYNEEEDVTVNLGQETLIRVLNNNGAAVLNGQAVRFDTSVGGEITVVRSLSDSVLGSTASGIATHDIPVGEIGYITRTGKIGGLDTSSWSSGDILFVSDTNPGELTNVSPAISNPIAVVINVDATEGTIFTATTRLKEPVAVGQNFNPTPGTQPVTTTPRPIEGYVEIAGLAENVLIDTPIGSDGERRCLISPLTTPFSGFYDFAFSSAFHSTGNVVVVAELYVNGVASGLISKSDVSNSQVDNGALIFPRTFTQAVLTTSDELEIYVYTEGGTSTLTYDSMMFNAKRAGLV